MTKSYVKQQMTDYKQKAITKDFALQYLSPWYSNLIQYDIL